MSCNTDPRPTTYEEWDALEANHDRLASDLQATRAELEETRHDLAKFQRSERVLAEMLREKMVELEMVRLANRVLDSAAKDAQTWAYMLQQCRAELERVRRNHLRRMGTSAVLRSWQQVDPDRADALTLFAARCFRAALASMETGRG